MITPEISGRKAKKEEERLRIFKWPLQEHYQVAADS
jgi:hypothetical protein